GYLRANRGYSLSSTQHVIDTATGEFTSEFGLEAWIDTRPETTAPDFEQAGLGEQPAWSDDGLNGNAAIHPRGTNNLGAREIQHLVAAGVWSPVDNQDAFTMTMVFKTEAPSVGTDAGGILFSTTDEPNDDA